MSLVLPFVTSQETCFWEPCVLVQKISLGWSFLTSEKFVDGNKYYLLFENAGKVRLLNVQPLIWNLEAKVVCGQT